METRPLGNTGMKASILGFGAAEIGFQAVDQATVARLLNEALDAGLNVIDTAECYRGSEELIGNAVGHRRQNFFLFTKCGHDGQSFNLADWHPEMLAQSIDRSLLRLKTDHVDLLQLHSCSLEALRQGDVIAVAQQARKAGKARFIGYSGDSAAARFALETGLFDTLQTSVSIADQEAVELTLPLAVQKKVGVIAKRPLANAVWRHAAARVSPYEKPYWERLQKLAYDFLQKPLPEAISTALRFTLACPGVSTAIVGTTRPGRWPENAALLNAGPLPPDRFQAIRTGWQKIAQPSWTGQT